MKTPMYEKLPCPNCKHPEVHVIRRDWGIERVGQGGVAMCENCKKQFYFRLVFSYDLD